VKIGVPLTLMLMLFSRMSVLSVEYESVGSKVIENEPDTVGTGAATLPELLTKSVAVKAIVLVMVEAAAPCAQSRQPSNMAPATETIRMVIPN
jgi:hypothetical protein